MKIVFFGSSKFSVIVANSLKKHHNLCLVVTIPDKEKGRKNILTPSPVKTFALENDILVLEVSRLGSGDVKKIKSFSPDFLVVADYGLFLPDSLLAIPKYAALNVHHSLLPKYRGPSPAPTAILNGEKISGVSIIEMSNQLDAGDILSQKKYTLLPTETTETLLTKLNELGGEIIIPVISDYIVGKTKPVLQDESKATYTKHMCKEDGFIDLANSPTPEKLDRMTRAYYPWPGVWTRLQDKIIKFLPNKTIQVEGKKPISYKDFVNGYPDAKGIMRLLLLEVLDE